MNIKNKILKLIKKLKKTFNKEKIDGLLRRKLLAMTDFLKLLKEKTSIASTATYDYLTKLFNADDSSQFHPKIVEIEENPVSPMGRGIFWMIIIFINIAILWMIFAKVDIVVSARGKVIPDGYLKIVQALEKGVIKKILVQEGDYVKKGQTLMEIDPSIMKSEITAKDKNLKHSELSLMRLKSLLSRHSERSVRISKDNEILTSGFRPPQDDGHYSAEEINLQKQIYDSSLKTYQSQLKLKQEELKQIKERIKRYSELLEYGLDREKRLESVADIISKNELDDIKKENLSYKSELEELKSKKIAINRELFYIKEEFKNRNYKELVAEEKQANELKADLEQVSFQNKKQEIISPTNGYVNKIIFHTEGGVVSPAQELISIVPDSTKLLIKATVLNQDIGFIKKDMPVSIKIDTFSFQKYGMLNGTVQKVSKDATEDEKLGAVYEVFVEPKETTLIVEGNPQRIKPGMSVSAEINIGKRRVIEFFIYPLVKYLDEGMSVR